MEIGIAMHRGGDLRCFETLQARTIHRGAEPESFRHDIKRKPHARGECFSESRVRQGTGIRATDGCENGLVHRCADFITGAQAIIKIENDGRGHRRILRAQHAWVASALGNSRLRLAGWPWTGTD